MARFKVDTRLALILGENYRSTELALKELVDNAWDADAENVRINLPQALEDGPIIISDDGCGMTTKELENEYLVIASDRIARKGEKTQKKNRKVKGRKGIGKFAGLVTANTMEIQSKARGIQTSLIIKKEVLLQSKRELEKIQLPTITTKVKDTDNGTAIILSDLNQNFVFPSIEKMKSILMFEYGRQSDFKIFVNDQLVGVEDLPGETFVKHFELEDVGEVNLKFTISEEKPLKNPGIVVKVNGKVIGKPSFFGLEDNENIPGKLLKRVYGEVEADGLANDVTADWGAIIENSNAFQDVTQEVHAIVEKEVKKTFNREVNLQKARIQKKINSQLQKLPENRREYAKKTLERILQRFSYENDERINTIISVILDALEYDEYWLVIQNIESAQKGDIFKLADALSEFGLIDMANIAIQAKRRLKLLDEIQKLIEDDNTLEITIHKALEKNLWVFGSHYSFMASNESLKSIVENKILSKYQGDKKKKRPDLLLSADFSERYLLLKFKRSNHKIDRDDENQAEKYRDELHQYLTSGKIEIIVIGGKKDSKIDSKYQDGSIVISSYYEIISKARTELEWLIRELGNN
ncbi:ATP-binding protein [Leptospira sp. 2 VSF19]|uniref:ATP-binding protein n=1 Tax=Leptospira soteropolitanensis TaxID=2950025 RepID=A0AAW5VEJ5_9LEPT|nr:ATP-binding protein [Leptospira soteropolitanensis]MCW7491961.1 ATP-binding protein [Leptospira soteropolitanensis]MCW7499544.1 ATP-binding protein [Leptospira soteropolitanensis]MCW7520865.1 ATP-binding protein [Leptospira soteropolitanensis]MCW7525648.1 ATP-binding protein [Leptospira soteropolitanensis]MCW7529514.1 ATP-binding protein [Leptospira soteropolitanensis]